MPTVHDIAVILNELAPLGLAEDWDNVGLLVGDRLQSVTRLMTCLTMTPETVAEAVEAGVELVVTHHPLPFRPLTSVTSDSHTGSMLLKLIGNGVAVFSAHTAFDSAASGINQRLAEGLGLKAIAPLVAMDQGQRGSGVGSGGENDAATTPPLGAGRFGSFARPLSLAEVVTRVKRLLSPSRVQIVGHDAWPISRLAVACGSGGSFLAAAQQNGCECLVTGETNFHTCVEAAAAEVALVLAGHFASERFAIVHLADELAARLPEIQVWPSRRETDPIRMA